MNDRDDRIAVLVFVAVVLVASTVGGLVGALLYATLFE